MYTIFKNHKGFRFARLPNGMLVPNQGRVENYDCSRDDHIELNFQTFLERQHIEREWIKSQRSAQVK